MAKAKSKGEFITINRENDTITIKNVILSYPHLFKKHAFEEGQEPKFSATFLIDKEEHEETFEILQGEIDRLALEKLGKKVKKDKCCLRDGDDSDKEENEGRWTLVARETKRPTVLDRDKTPLTEEDDKLYAGCIVNVQIRLWAQDNKFGKRINANLFAVQFVEEGEPLSSVSRPDADDAFDDIDGDDDGGKKSKGKKSKGKPAKGKSKGRSRDDDDEDEDEDDEDERPSKSKSKGKKAAKGRSRDDDDEDEDEDDEDERPSKSKSKSKAKPKSRSRDDDDEDEDDEDDEDERPSKSKGKSKSKPAKGKRKPRDYDEEDEDDED